MIEQNIEHVRGDSELLKYEVNDDTGADVNLSGATVVDFTVKRRVSDDDTAAVLRKRLSAGFAIINAAQGLVQVTINPGDTDNLRPGSYRYDVQVREASGRLSTLAKGRFKVTADISRANT